ncbi:fatty acyl-AMP ligase [Aquabacterium sp.]|uniref:fatty acyl-AMP ligase n=1 Tax=Aquabacterium sp. TaxID=1872578 RepID=UPI00403815AA
MMPTTHSLVHALDTNAQLFPTKLAFKYVGKPSGTLTELTFRELSEASRWVAVELLNRPIRPTKAILLYPQCLDFIVGFMACLRSGVVAVPLSLPINRQDQTRFLSVLDDCAPDLVLTVSAIEAMPEVQMLKQLRPEMDWVSTDTVTGARSHLDLSASHVAPTGGELAFLQYTSGSTGMPKGVMVSHDNIMHNQRMITAAFQNTTDDSVASWLPLFHDMGLIGGILQPIYLGMSCYLMSPFDFLQKPLRWLQAISEHGATVSGGPNFAYELCVRKVNPQDLAGLDLSRWRLAFNGAEPIRATSLRAFSDAFAGAGFQHRSHFPCYGLAEGTLFVSGGPSTELPVLLQVDAAQMEAMQAIPAMPGKPQQELVGSGVAAEGLRVVAADPETRLPLPASMVGEVWVSGPSVATGYWKKEQATQETFAATLLGDKRAYLRTGDLGFMTETGELVITGRVKDLIILRGKNYYPHDLELIAEQAHPSIRTGSAAAFVASEDDGVWVLAEIRKDALDTTDFAEVKLAIKTKVNKDAGVAVSGVTLLEPGKVSKTTSGKIRRQDCRVRLLEGKLKDLADTRV